MRVMLYLNKSVEENAAMYFEEGKKAKRKVGGVKETIQRFSEEQEAIQNVEVKSQTKIKRLGVDKKQWFEKFKWFFSSDGHLIIAGRDATTNEIIIKKHTDKKDLVFHTDMAGSPFAVIKNDRTDAKRLLGEDWQPLWKPEDEELLKEESGFTHQIIFETASFVAVHSRAWKAGHGTAQVFFVKPDQVTKEANSGEFLPKGAFMIRGETQYVEPTMDFAIGLLELNGVQDADGQSAVMIMGGPLQAVQANCKHFVRIEQGNTKASQVASSIANTFKANAKVKVALDDIVKVLPSGGCQIVKERKRKK